MHKYTINIWQLKVNWVCVVAVHGFTGVGGPRLEIHHARFSSSCVLGVLAHFHEIHFHLFFSVMFPISLSAPALRINGLYLCIQDDAGYRTNAYLVNSCFRFSNCL